MSARAPARRTKKAPAAKKENPLFPSRPRSTRIGGDIRPQKDLSRFVRWPKYIRIQRQRKVLYQRLKVPPAVNQFREPLDRAEAVPVFRLLSKYRPETPAEKKARIAQQAEAKAAGRADGTGAAPQVIKFGLNHVTYLIEQKKAKLVLIAADVDPIELVVWLPALCRKMNVPYAIVNGKARLGALVHQKKAAVAALTSVQQADQPALDAIVENAKARFSNNVGQRRKWGGGVMGLKTIRKVEARDKLLKESAAKKAAVMF